MIVLNFNGGELVHQSVASICGSRWPADALEVVLVDNASTDGSADRVAIDFPAVRIIQSSSNRGFPANNLGMHDLAGVDYVALVNPDAFVDPDWLTPLVDALAGDKQLGAACPLILFAAPDDQGREVVNNAGCEVLANGYARDRDMGVVYTTDTFEPIEVFAWSGGAVLLRREYLEDVGLFDERFFLYYEDIDLSWRGRLRGWRYRLVPASVVHHHHAATVGIGSRTHRYYTERNRLLMLMKDAPVAMVTREVLRFPLSTASYLWTEAFAPLVRGRRPRFATVALRVRAFAGAARHALYALRGRRRIQSRRTEDPQRLVAELIRDNTSRRT